MTIQAVSRKAGPYAGNGVTTAFPFSFQVTNKTYLSVVKTDSTGADVPLVLDTHYSVALNADQIANPGGAVTYPLTGSALAVGSSLTVNGSEQPASQETDLTNGGGFFPDTLEQRLDYITTLLQQHDAILARAVKGPPTDAADLGELPVKSLRIGKFIAFDVNGDPTVSTGSGGGDTSLRMDLANAVAGVDGSRLVGYRRTETGSLAQSVFDRLFLDIWVNDFTGADPTGTTDSSAAFNAAIAAAAARGVGTVKIRGGKYKVNLDITTSNIKLVGERRAYTSTTVGLYPFSNADWVVDIGSAGASTNDWALENISIHGHGGGDLGLRIRNCRNWSLRDVDIIGFDVYSMLVTSTAGIGTAYGDLINFTCAASIAGSVGARFESGTGYCTAIRITNSDFHSTAGTSWAVELDASGAGSDGVFLTMIACWIECGDDRGVRFATTATEIVCAGVDIDSSSSADSLVTIPTDSRIGDYLKGMVRIDGVVTTSAGDTAAVSSRWHMPNETFYMFPQVQGALNFQNASLNSYQQHVAGLQNQRISRAGASLDIRSTDGDVRLHMTTAAAGGALRLNGAGSVGIYRGTGTPEGAVSAPIGSLFLRENGGAATTLYVKESGVSNTGWIAK